ncbi:hypothetical protein CCHR01_06629 [Colletotrichum chrysophilum]|uniref:Uncharacterized protein n=1 Tax=Colletotrichum chrysophilum TaxID=1836956 RepID=A0AAD9EJK8_9PEZI|nr:hypothetical protein CCHR01_06629 [Colletotrichum chrysophilum]
MGECTSISRSISAPNPPSESQKLRWHGPRSQKPYAASTYALTTETLPPSPPCSVILWSSSSATKSRASGSEDSDRYRGQANSASLTGSAAQADTDTSYQPSEIYGNPRGFNYDSRLISPGDDFTGWCPWGEISFETQRPQTLGNGLIANPENFKSSQSTEPRRHAFSPVEDEPNSPDSPLAVDMTEEDFEESPLGDYTWEQNQSLKDFQEDPAHEFWKWDIEREQWFHRDEDTGSVIWCPTELD